MPKTRKIVFKFDERSSESLEQIVQQGRYLGYDPRKTLFPHEVTIHRVGHEPRTIILMRPYRP